MSVTVRTQQELDQALADGAARIIISSERGAWIRVGDTGSATVEAWDSATVTARGSATVTARGSATVTARDSATVTASPYVAVHLHSALCAVKGGAIIDVTRLDLTDPTT